MIPSSFVITIRFDRSLLHNFHCHDNVFLENLQMHCTKYETRRTISLLIKSFAVNTFPNVYNCIVKHYQYTSLLNLIYFAFFS